MLHIAWWRLLGIYLHGCVVFSILDFFNPKIREHYFPQYYKYIEISLNQNLKTLSAFLAYALVWRARSKLCINKPSANRLQQNGQTLVIQR